MCGIVGLTQPKNVSPETFDRMVDSMAARGPDARGVFRDERVALGHRRLSILDLSPTANQPMANEDDSIVIVYNGECYNHRELRASCRFDRWKTDCDTETLLRLYEERGPRFLADLNGMFALAIYDTQRGTVLLARDRLGIKPLYHADFGNGHWMFASDTRAFRLHPKFNNEIDPLALRDYFLCNYISAPTSIYRQVHQLRPAHYAIFDLKTGAMKTRAYWRVPHGSQATKPTNRTSLQRVLSEKTDRLETLLLDAVRAQTISDVPLGSFLSGGLDSTAVTWALARSTSRARTFTIGFEEPEYDESPFAQRIAKHLGTEHHCEILSARDCLPLIENLPSVSGEPFADASILPTLLLSRMTRRSVTVALSGDGGDELFLGYDRYRWAEQAVARTHWMPNILRRAGAHTAAALPHYRMQMMGRGMRFRDARTAYPWIFIGWNHEWVNRLLARHDDFARHPICGFAERQNTEQSLAERAGRLDLVHYLPGDILTKVDRATMHYSLEARVPLLDHRLVEFAASLPTWMKMNDTRQKILLRRLLGRHIPGELLNRPKRGFAVPLRAWFRGELRGLLQDVLSPWELRQHGFFNERFIQTMIERHQTGRWNFERQLWALLVFQLWYRSQR